MDFIETKIFCIGRYCGSENGSSRYKCSPISQVTLLSLLVHSKISYFSLIAVSKITFRQRNSDTNRDRDLFEVCASFFCDYSLALMARLQSQKTKLNIDSLIVGEEIKNLIEDFAKIHIQS